MEIEVVALHNGRLQITGIILHQAGRTKIYYGEIYLKQFPHILEKYQDKITNWIHQDWYSDVMENPSKLLFDWSDFEQKKMVKIANDLSTLQG